MDINVILNLDDDHTQTRPTTEIQFTYIIHIICNCMPVLSNFNVSHSMLEKRETGEAGSVLSFI